MPRPRFGRLSSEKRDRIMEAAAKEFAAYGYHDASMNQILDAAGISKGAAYYYFDDKADLFATTVQYYADKLVGDLPAVLEDVDAETFWPALSDLYARQFAYFHDMPWGFGVVKAAGRLSREDVADMPALQELIAQVEHTVAAVLQRGQSLGVIRTDLPDDLLANLFTAVDDATDRWLLQHWEQLDQDEVEATVRRIMPALGRMLAPPDEDFA